MSSSASSSQDASAAGAAAAGAVAAGAADVNAAAADAATAGAVAAGVVASGAVAAGAADVGAAAAGAAVATSSAADASRALVCVNLVAKGMDIANLRRTHNIVPVALKADDNREVAVPKDEAIGSYIQGLPGFDHARYLNAMEQRAFNKRAAAIQRLAMVNSYAYYLLGNPDEAAITASVDVEAESAGELERVTDMPADYRSKFLRCVCISDTIVDIIEWCSELSLSGELKTSLKLPFSPSEFYAEYTSKRSRRSTRGGTKLKEFVHEWKELEKEKKLVPYPNLPDSFVSVWTPGKENGVKKTNRYIIPAFIFSKSKRDIIQFIQKAGNTSQAVVEECFKIANPGREMVPHKTMKAKERDKVKEKEKEKRKRKDSDTGRKNKKKQRRVPKGVGSGKGEQQEEEEDGEEEEEQEEEEEESPEEGDDVDIKRAYSEFKGKLPDDVIEILFGDLKCSSCSSAIVQDTDVFICPACKRVQCTTCSPSAEEAQFKKLSAPQLTALKDAVRIAGRLSRNMEGLKHGGYACFLCEKLYELGEHVEFCTLCNLSYHTMCRKLGE